MIIGVPKEIKNNEYRVGLLPVGVETLIQKGHQVLIEKNAGLGSGISNEDYAKQGARIVNTAGEIYADAELIIKIKEPQPSEYSLLKKGRVIFTYFHFAASRELTQAMLERGITAFAYETLQVENGELPCLTPMSEVAGRMSVHEGAKYLEEPMKGRGILLAGVPGVSPAEVVILGAGVVGSNACKMAAGMGANVTIMDINLNRLRFLDEIMPPNVHTLMSNSHNIREAVLKADLLISSVLIRGAKAPVLVTRDMVRQMKTGAVIVDVAIDQGGSLQTSRPTTHQDPTYVVDGVVHYCVTNMPGAVARTSSYALTNATLPYILMLADLGAHQSILQSYPMRRALNMINGHLVIKEVAETFGLPWREYEAGSGYGQTNG
jgi:alanine dehydrogenase